MTLRPTFVLLALAALTTFCPDVQAQTAQFIETAIIRSRENRPVGLENVVNFDDCSLDDEITVSVTTTGLVSGIEFFVYASKDDVACEVAINRDDAAQCRKIATITASSSSEFRFRAPNLVFGTCELNGQSTTMLQILLQNADGISTAAPLDEWKWTVDTTRPAAPTNVTVASLDSSLTVKWTKSASSDLENNRVYCQATGGDLTTEECVAPDIVADAIAKSEFRTGKETSDLAIEGDTGALTNNLQYACAVTAVDDAGNEGLLSEVACGVPLPTTGFYEAYRDSGGLAGGGYCAFGRGSAGSPFAAGLALVGLTALLRRARRGAR